MSTKEEVYGNLDSKQEFPVPSQWLEDPNIVIVQQERIEQSGRETHYLPHQQPVQVYSKQAYERLSANKSEGFKDLGIKATVLHKPETGAKAEKVAKTDKPKTTPAAGKGKPKATESAPNEEVITGTTEEDNQ